MPPFPVALAYLWRSYLRLRKRKGPTDTGASKPVEWPDIESFTNLSGLHFVPWEVEIFERLDDIYLDPSATPTPTAPEGQAVVALASSADAAGVRSILGSVGKRRIVKRKKD